MSKITDYFIFCWHYRPFHNIPCIKTPPKPKNYAIFKVGKVYFTNLQLKPSYSQFVVSFYTTLRQKTYDLLEGEREHRSLGSFIDIFLVGLIITNVIAVIISSDNPTYYNHKYHFDLLEDFSLYIFCAEYLLRLWCIPVGKKTGKSDIRARFNWVKSPMALIDLIAILPSLLEGVLGLDFRVLRLLRMLRILKLSRYSAALRLLLKVLSRERNSLQAMMFILSILIVIAASGIHFVEHEVQPEVFGSIPKAMWWAVVTLTTVGYGDVTPITPMGKVFGAFVTILGIGIAALPAGILASGFATELSERRKRLEQKFRAHLLSDEIDLNHSNKIEMIRRELGLNKDEAQEIVLDLLRENALEEREEQRKKENAHEHNKATQAHQAVCPHCGEVFHIGTPDNTNTD